MKKPMVAVVDWKLSPRGDKKCTVEKDVIGEWANVKYFLCDKAKDWKGEVLKADVILLWHNATMPSEVINKLEDCKGIIRYGTGYDTVDHLTAVTRDIPVFNVPDYGTDEVADHSIALAMALCRQILPIDKICKDLKWEIPEENKRVIRRLNTMRFGVLGLGCIGTSVALKAKAMGFKVYFYDPYTLAGIDKSLGIKRERNFDNFVSNMDLISINCPLTDTTRYMFKSKQFKMMKDNAFIVNTARGAIIDKNDLFKALKNKDIAGAALDVIDNEPLRSKKEAKTPNLLVTCHSGFYSIESTLEMKQKVATAARDLSQGKMPENCINCKFLPRNFLKDEK